MRPEAIAASRLLARFAADGTTALQLHTSGEFTIRRFPAGHFFVLERSGAVMAAIAAQPRAGGAR